jgi:uncharacterized damage-inducible protein DinB
LNAVSPTVILNIMKEYLISLFKYNDWAFRKLLETVKQLPDQDEAVRLLSHLIIAQNKWYDRVTKQPEDAQTAWFGVMFPITELDTKWDEVENRWLEFLQKSDEELLGNFVIFDRPSDGKSMKVKICDIMLQINYHAIGHRAQINHIIRLQGMTPPQADYIMTALSEA